MTVIVPALSEGEAPGQLEVGARAAGLSVHHVRGFVGPEHVPHCDLLLVAHAHVFITAAARARTRFGALGYHPSLLPRHRGRDAVHWALHMRESVTGGSLYWLDDGADTGPVVDQGWCHIRPDDTPASIWRRELAPMALRMFTEAMDQLEVEGACEGVPQDETLATWEPSWSKGKLSD
jgi:methionyl-tRNA formyltransferase